MISFTKSYFYFILCFFLLHTGADCLFAQNNTSFFQRSDTLNKNRRTAVYITEAALGTAALIGLNEAWYAQYDRSGFHSLNDNSQWMQMDKFGHAFSSYYIGKMGMDALAWAGETKKNQLIYGATLGFVFLGTIEVLDGFSEEWGFSTGDIMANAFGTGLLIGQELLWDEQRIQMKFSFQHTAYADNNPDKLGSTRLQQLLKDYNGQTYWLSANIKSFLPKKSKFPAWISVSAGYGAEGMLGANSNPPSIGGEPLPEFPRYRKYFFSLDVDLPKIKTRSHFLKFIFNGLNFIKIPFPTLEYNKEEGVVFHPIYF